MFARKCAPLVAEEFPEILGATASSVDNGSSLVVDLGSPSAGERLLVITQSRLHTPNSVTSGWSLAVEVKPGGSSLRGYTKIASGSDTLTIGFSSDNYTAAIALRISSGTETDWLTYTGSYVDSTGTSADPPSHNAGSTRKHLWLAMVGTLASATITNNDSDYTAFTQVSVGITSGVSLGGAWAQIEAQTEDPAAFTLSSARWRRTATIAIAP